MKNTKIEWTDDSWQTITAAKRIGIPVEEYVALRSSGKKWCTACRIWHETSEFGSDSQRGDGLSANCLASRRVKVLSPNNHRPKHGWLKPTRDGDKKQARRRVNYLVETGAIPHPDDLPCMDCGDGVFMYSYRHEYDHAKGYASENQLYVEPVCSRCHHNREEIRRG